MRLASRSMDQCYMQNRLIRAMDGDRWRCPFLATKWVEVPFEAATILWSQVRVIELHH
jgi:hypothetical protein